MELLKNNDKAFCRFVSFVLALCVVVLCFGLPYQAANAVVGTTAAVITIIIAGLAAMGITFVSTGAYNSLNEYVGSLLGQYAQSQSTSVADLTSGCNAGANTVGQLLLNNRFVILIDGFAAWLRLTFGLSNNATITVVSPGTVINDLTMYTLPIAWNNGRYNYEWTIVTASATVYCLFGTASSSMTIDQSKAWFFSDTQATIHRKSWNQYGTSERDYTMQSGDIYAYPYYSYAGDNLGTDGNYTAYLYDEWYPKLKAGNEIEENTSGTQVDIKTGTINLPTEGNEYSTGDGAVIDLQLPWGVTYPEIVEQWIPAEWTDTKSGNPSITYDPAGTIAGQVDTTPSTPYVSDDPGEYSVPGLKDVFPFCIPFDLYALLSALAADPVAPSFQWRFYLPDLVDQTITIDFAPYDSVAQIVRTMELLAFCVGLAFETRNLIRG